MARVSLLGAAAASTILLGSIWLERGAEFRIRKDDERPSATASGTISASPSASAIVPLASASADVDAGVKYEDYCLQAGEGAPPAPTYPFPHPVSPGAAMRRVLDWAHRHHAAKQPSIWHESVSCPKDVCVDPDDCWFHIRLDDAAATSVSHLVAWLEVHAITGDIRWQGTLGDGGYGYVYDPASKSHLPPPSAPRRP